MKGFLKKKSPKGLPGMHAWQMRWFELTAEHITYWEISMEGEELVVFDEKAFKTQWEENGMGNESMWKFFGRSYGQIVDTILRPMAEQVRADRGLSGLSIYLSPAVLVFLVSPCASLSLSLPPSLSLSLSNPNPNPLQL